MLVTGNVLGNYDKSIGKVTFQKWKDKLIGRQKPELVSNPNTVLQQGVRAAFKARTAFFRLIAQIVMIGLREFATTSTQLAKFQSFNKAAIKSDGQGGVDITNEDIVIAKGSLGNTFASSVALNGAGTGVTISYPSSLDFQSQSNSDMLCVLLVNEDKDADIKIKVDAALRSAGTATVTLPPLAVSGDHIGVYYFFKSQTSDKVSDSVYAQITV